MEHEAKHLNTKNGRDAGLPNIRQKEDYDASHTNGAEPEHTNSYNAQLIC